MSPIESKIADTKQSTSKQRDEAEQIDFTSSNEIKNLKPYDRTVEVIGYIEDIEGPKTVGLKQLLMCQFLLNNGNGEKIQVIAWNEEVKKLAGIINVNKIVHLDGVLANPIKPKSMSYNKGTVPMELVVKSNTVLTILGFHEIKQTIAKTTEIETVSIRDAGKNRNFVQIEGFLKSAFRLLKKQNGVGPEFGVGAITDGEFKLEVRIFDYDGDHDIRKGDHVSVKGFVQINANPMYIRVIAMSDVKTLDTTRMGFSNLLQGYKRVQRPTQ